VIAPACILVLVAALVAAGAMFVHPRGRNRANLLALVLSLALTAATAGLVALARRSGDRMNGNGHHLVGLAGLLLLGYLGVAFVGHLLAAAGYGRRTRPRHVAYVLVLGAGLIGSRVTRLLASRLDRALQVLASPRWNPGGHAKVIVSGGQGADELVTEAAAMAAYLATHGVRPDDILVEERATTTSENMRYSGEIIAGRAAGSRVAVVTSDFHVLRAALLARRMGMDASVLGSWTAWYYLPRAVLREFAAVFVLHLWAHALVGVALLAWAVSQA